MGIFLHIEIDRAIALVSKTVFKNGLHQLNLLNDVTRSGWFNAGREHIELSHVLAITECVSLNHFHWLKLVEFCFGCNFIIPFVGIIYQMANIGDIPDIPYPISKMPEIAINQIERDGRTGMTQMGMSINGWATNIHPYKARGNWGKNFLPFGKGIINQ